MIAVGLWLALATGSKLGPAADSATGEERREAAGANRVGPGSAGDSPGATDSPGPAELGPASADASPGSSQLDPASADASPGSSQLDPASDDAAPGAVDSTEPSQRDPASDDAAPVIGDPASEAKGPMAVDLVLPCGLRVILAEDRTLPVAAVILAIDTGTEDDPAKLPGLVHALAYHLLQGNRQLAPGAATATIQNGGGISRLAVGPAQVRYESLVPSSLLSEALWIESQRLRAPTISPALWKKTLAWAGDDRPRRWSIPATARAAVHGVAGLDHEGTEVGAALSGLDDAAVATQLAKHFSYERATLIVVAPTPLSTLAGEVGARFADLPAAPRQASRRSTAQRAGTSPAQVPVPKASRTFVWPLGSTPAAQLWAQVVCDAIALQRRSAEDPARGKLRCNIEDDPRRGLMVVRPSGSGDLAALLRHRLARLVGPDLPLLVRARDKLRARMAIDLRTPLALARQLARVDGVATGNQAAFPRPLAELTGLASLTSAMDPLPPEASSALELGRAIEVVATPAGDTP